MTKKKRAPLYKRILAMILFTLVWASIALVLTVPFLVSDWLDYCSDGQFSKSVKDIWKC